MSVPTFFVFKTEFASIPNRELNFHAKSVEVAGSFNNWIKVKMEKVYAKDFTLTLELPPGQYQYKFFVNDKIWTHNKQKPTTPDNVGGFNNVITVVEKGDLKIALKDALEADYEKLKNMRRLNEKFPFDVSYELLVSKIENDINGVLKEGYWTLLGSSAAFGWEEVCKLLISAGADVNMVNGQCQYDQWSRKAQSPLYCAAKFGWPNICEMLLSAGAVIKEEGCQDWQDAMNAAKENKHRLCIDTSEIIDMFKKHISSFGEFGSIRNSDQVPEDRQVSMREILSAPWNRISVPTRFVFTTKQDGASPTHVEVAGSFNNWIKVKMCEDTDEWTVTLALPPGQYEYKFFEDNKWIHDKEKPTTQDSFGGLNNVITVEEKEEKGGLKLKAALKDALEADIVKVKNTGEFPFEVSYELLASKIENDVNGPMKEGYPSCLHYSAILGWEEVCKVLISAGADANMKETCYDTRPDPSPLYFAAEFGWPNICKLLLSAGAVINIKDPWNWSEHDTSKYYILDIAKKNNHTQVIDILEEHISSLPPWTLEQVLKDYGISLSEINKEMEIYSKAPWNGITALSYYAAIGKKDACKALIEGGADVNKMNVDGSTALIMAIRLSAQNGICKLSFSKCPCKMTSCKDICKIIKRIPEPGYIEIAKTLLFAGADAVKRRDYNGKTGLFYAVSEGHTDIVRAILEKEIDLSGTPCQAENDWTPIMEAVQKGYTEICKMLIDAGAELDKQNDDGNTALMIAAKDEKPEFCRMLLSAGADISKRDRDHYGKTALDIAKSKDPSTMTQNNLDVIDVFEKHGVHVTPLQLDQVLMRDGVYEDNIDELYGDGITALMFSIKIGNEDDCKFLIESGADVNWTNGIILRPLATAVAYGRENLCKMLIEAGGDVNSRDGEGKTPLIHAILHDKQNICKILIETGADVELPDEQGKQPLVEAADHGRENIFKMLMEAGASIEKIDCPGLLYQAIKNKNIKIGKMILSADSNFEILEPLYIAAKKGFVDIVQMIIEKRPDIDFDDVGYRFLKTATINGHAKICKLLIDAGVDPLKEGNKKPYNKKPLIYAAEYDHTDIVKMFLEKFCEWLIEAGAVALQKPNDKKVREALFHAADKGLTDIVKMIIENAPNMDLNDYNITPLMAAIDNVGTLKLLVDAGADLNKQNEDGYTALILAIDKGYTESIELLIEVGAVALKNPNDEKVREALYHAANNDLADIVKMIIEKIPNMDINDYDTVTPLMAAIRNGNVEIVKLLMDAGADLDKQNDFYDEDTPLIYAIRKGEVEICKLLVEAGADLDKLNDWFGDKGTALMWAIIKRDVEVCKLLVEAGADLDKQNEDGYTALMKATKEDVEVCKMLVESGADLDKQNKDGFTALMKATKEDVEVCKMLVEAGADLDKQNKDGFTALILAAEEGRKDICDILLTAGADANITCVYEKCKVKRVCNACGVAMHHNHDEVVGLFKKHGVTSNINILEQLESAVIGNRLYIVKMIIEKRPDLDVDDYSCSTPLMNAAFKGQAEICKLLLEAGADPFKNYEYAGPVLKAPDYWFDHNEILQMTSSNYDLLLEIRDDPFKYFEDAGPALKVAVGRGHTDIVQMFLEKLSNMNVDMFTAEERHRKICTVLVESLKCATKNGKAGISKMLIEAGAVTLQKPNDKKLLEALYYAADKGLTEIVKMIIENAPKIDLNEYGSKSTLIAAIDNVEILKLLIEAGADLDKQNEDGYTALMKAAQYGCKDVCDVLLTAGADANIMCDVNNLPYVNKPCYKRYKRYTALMLAVSKGHIDCVKIIVDKRPDDLGCAALMLATDYRQNEICKLLIEAGANPFKDDEYYGTAPLKSATKEHDTDIVKIFLEKIPNMNVDNYKEKTPLMAATDESHTEICKTLLDSLELALNCEYKYSGEDISKMLIEAGALKNEDIRQALLTAVCQDFTDIVKMIFEKTPNMDVMDVNDYNGFTPLMGAVGNGNVEIFKLLVEAGADLNKQINCDMYPDTPIYSNIFLDNFRSYPGDTPLIHASRKGQVEMCKLLIEAGAELDKQNVDGFTALMQATQKDIYKDIYKDITRYNIDKVGIVKLLVEAGADLDKLNKDGYTALILAAKEGHKDVCDILLTAKADANITCVYKEIHKKCYLDNPCNRDRKSTACDIAMFEDYDEVVGVFEKHGQTSIKLQLKSAAKDGHIDIAKKIIEERPDLDVDDHDFRYSPLMSATSNGYVAMCKLLMEAGADPLKTDGYDKYSPLTCAAKDGHTDIVKMFLEKLPNVAATEEIHAEVREALYHAADNGRTDIVKIIIEKAPNIDVNDYDSKIPLMAAIGNVETFKLLMEAGADFEKQTEYYEYNTPLMNAAKYGKFEVCKLLVESGADLDKRNRYGSTALDYAARDGHSNICNLLQRQRQKNHCV